MNVLEGATFATEKAKEFVSGTTKVLSQARSIVSGDALFFSTAPKIDDLRFALASDSVYEKRDAMKRIVAQMCKGADMHPLFPDVVKNIHAPSMELRKLIYLFVVHYAADCPNEALLSISAFQKDLMDPSVHVRSLALRMLGSMQIPAVHPVVMVAVKKSAADGAAVVRKTAAIALWQMHWVSKQETMMASVYEVLRELLNDKQPDVVGAAVMAFERVCKHKIDLLHPVYRHLCNVLPDCEEWGQDAILRVLLRYARDQFCDPAKPRGAPPSSRGGSSSSSNGGGHSHEDVKDPSAGSESDSSSSSSSSSDDGGDGGRVPGRGKRLDNRAPHNVADGDSLDPDHQLLLTAARPLLFSLSSSVVVSVCALYYHCAPPSYLDYCVKPLMRVLRGSKEGHSVLLKTAYSLLERRPEAFAPYLKEFFLLTQDSADVRALKHRILSRLAAKENAVDLFREYRFYVHGANEEVAAEAVRGLALLASHHPSFSALTMRLLTPLLSQSSPVIVTEAVAVLRLLVMQGKGSQSSVRLVFRLMQQVMNEEVNTPSAVATVLWLVGECLRTHPAMAAAAPDCFRVFLQRFPHLDRRVKQEVLTLGWKTWLQLDGHTELAERFRQVFFYALELARYDENYLVRDQARLMECACDRDSEAFRAIKASLEGEKALPRPMDPYASHQTLELGTLSHYFGSPMLCYEELPPWRIDCPDPSLRRASRATSDNAMWSASGESSPLAFGGGRRKKAANTTWSSSSSSSSPPSSKSSASGADSSAEREKEFYSEPEHSTADSPLSSLPSSQSHPTTDDSDDSSSALGAAAAPATKPISIKMVVKPPQPSRLH